MHSTFIFLAVENLFFSIKRSIDSEKIRMFIKSEMTLVITYHCFESKPAS